MTDDPVLAAAARWHSAVRSGRVDWDGFVAWLEADPAHRDAYDTIMLVETMAAEDAYVPAGAANDDAPAAVARRALRWPAIGAAAGLAAAAVLAIALFPRGPTPLRWQTGEDAQVVAFADGVAITLAPHSTLSRAGSQLRLEGSAVFAVAHRPARALAIAAGPLIISDIGTHFDLRVDPATVRLVLDEGRVAVAGERLEHPLSVGAGQAVLFDQAAGTMTVGAAATGAVGDWQRGQLSYRDAPLSLVANDISRYGHATLRVSGAAAQLRFSGNLRLGPGHDPAQELARIMALELDRNGGGAVLHSARTDRSARQR